MTNSPFAIGFEDVVAAADRVNGVVLKTPFTSSPLLSRLAESEIYIKYENLQITGSFKERGALNKLLTLNDEQRSRGVIAMSAGNHAQAVACHASRLGLAATIVMPEGTPFLKIANTEAWGARVLIQGKNLHEAQIAVNQIVGDEKLTLIHPYDDPQIIAGQGTIALEILEDVPDLEALVIPIGGGGLFAGIAMAARHLNPDIEIYGVECSQYPSMSLALNKEVQVQSGQTIAEGIAVKNIGALTRPIAEALNTEIFVISESEIEKAVATFLTVQKTVVEGAGAVVLAAVLENPKLFRNKKTGLILSGGNIDPRMLSSILIRELERKNKIITLRLETEDQPGTLGRIATELGRCGANILEVSHDRLLQDIPAKNANIDVTIEIKDARHAQEVMSSLAENGFKVLELEPANGQSDGSLAN
ncbi:MAG: threonine ammonia-lyase [Methyloligellaceae bacterium]